MLQGSSNSVSSSECGSRNICGQSATKLPTGKMQALGHCFPAPVQSTAENKDPDTQGGNTWKSLLRAEASFRASHCHQQSFFFAVKAVLEPPIGA